MYFYLSTERGKRKGSPDVMLSPKYLLTGFRLATYQHFKMKNGVID